MAILKGIKEFKELEIILSSFECDKNCPYCTAKITKWDKVKDDIHLLELNVGQLKRLGYKFHYVTIGGNGEPTLHSYDKLKNLVEIFDDFDIPVKRVLSSGNIFRLENREKLELFIEHNWFVEITVTDGNIDKSNSIQGYDFNYLDTSDFRRTRIRLNYVLLKSNYDYFIDDIIYFAKTFDNIEVLSLKLLNVNTKSNKVDNPLSKWIVDNAISKDNRQNIKDILDKNFDYVGEKFDTHSWNMKTLNREVYFSWKKVEYGLYDLVWYGNRFVNYQLETIELDLVPKVYVASRFIKEKTEHGISFRNDFRTKLIGTEKNFVNFNSNSFILRDNLPIAQYLGPFYNEKASDGELTSTACEEVVRTENDLIEKCDIFVCYFDEVLSPGGICELVYAVLLGKKIRLFYKVENGIDYCVKSSAWYPITFSNQVAKDIQIKQVHNVDELLSLIKFVV